MSNRQRVASPPPKPVMIYDGDCSFCVRWINRWRECSGDAVDYVPMQDPRAGEWFPEISREQLEQAVHLVEVDGGVYRGAEAAALALRSGNRFPLWLYRNVPGCAAVAEFTYEIVARNRALFSTLTRWLWGKSVEQPVYVRTRTLFLRLLGVVYILAFASFGIQISALIGSQGIIPVADFLRAVEENTRSTGSERYWTVPTFCWWSSSDTFLRLQCVAGVALGTALLFNVAPALCCFLLWLLYLSLVTAGGIFMGYQWDNLMLETGFLAILFAPWQWWPRLERVRAVPRIPLWLLRWLLFRLMFSSGCVKLLSGDPTWRDFSALTFHYQTQPLPTWIGWYAHQLPDWFQKFSTLVMFGIELVVPFLIFLPQRPRLVAFYSFISLQLLIAVTGNYTFFNLLTCVLCVVLLNDRTLPKGRHKESPTNEEMSMNRVEPYRLQKWMTRGVGLIIFCVSIPVFARTLRIPLTWPQPWVELCQLVSPFRSVNDYGLFRRMTTIRNEIVLEGSNDGANWKEYEFKHKPGRLDRRPDFVAPHQPRLDWQMWFAALGDVRGNRWFLNFCVRVLQGQPDVLALLESNPFPDSPPRFVRARLYEYRFSDFAERRKSGAWYVREFRREYCPPLTLNAPE